MIYLFIFKALFFTVAQRIIFSLDQRATPFCILLALAGFKLPPGHRANYNVDPCPWSEQVTCSLALVHHLQPDSLTGRHASAAL